MDMRKSHEILISARDAEALSLMLGDWPRRHRLEEDAADALVDTLVGARVVPAHHVPTNVVTMGSTVTYVDILDGAEQTVTIVFPAQADAGAGRVSVLSPIGRALLGRTVGTVVDLTLPTGRHLAVRIVEVVRGNVKDEEALALV
jgi:regulator of nucleoside diphosphate kinase